MSSETVLATKEEWEQTYWIDSTSDPIFQRKNYSASLVNNHNILFPEPKKGSRVYVPCCGKARDMIYLADMGHEVIGVEYARNAIEGFHKDNSLTYTTKDVDGGAFVLYCTNEKNIKIYQGDVFGMNTKICGQFDSVFDRGGYNSISNPTTRNTYCSVVRSLLETGGKILLETRQHDRPVSCGPPYSMTMEEIAKDYTHFKVTALETYEDEIGLIYTSILQLKA